MPHVGRHYGQTSERQNAAPTEEFQDLRGVYLLWRIWRVLNYFLTLHVRALSTLFPEDGLETPGAWELNGSTGIKKGPGDSTRTYGKDTNLMLPAGPPILA